MIGEKIEHIIKNTVVEILSKGKKVEHPEDIITTDNIGEVIEKLAILHCRMWYLEDAVGSAKTDGEVADLKRKIDICFKVKRPRYVEALNQMINLSIKTNKELVEDSVKLYNGFSNSHEPPKSDKVRPEEPQIRIIPEGSEKSVKYYQKLQEGSPFDPSYKPKIINNK